MPNEVIERAPLKVERAQLRGREPIPRIELLPSEVDETPQSPAPAAALDQPVYSAPGSNLIGTDTGTPSPITQAFPTEEVQQNAIENLPPVSLEAAAFTPFAQIPRAPLIGALKLAENAIMPNGADLVPEGVNKGIANTAAQLAEQTFLTRASGPLAVVGAIPGARTIAGAVLSAAAAKTAGEKLGEASVTHDPQTMTEGVLLGALAGVGGVGVGLDIARSNPMVAARELAASNTNPVPPLTKVALEGGAAALSQAEGVTREVAAQSTPEAKGVTTLPSEGGNTLRIAPRPIVALPSLSDLHDVVTGVTDDAKAFLKGAAGESLPRMVEANPEAGEAGVSFASARLAAPLKAQLFVQEALKDTGVDPVAFGAALTEDNLRSVREQRLAAGADPATVNVNTVIGKRGSPFATEAQYQAFLSDPATQKAVAQYKTVWDAVKEPQYRLAASIDPATPLASRGVQTGARINLFGVKAGETPPTGVRIAGGGGGGNLLATLRRKSPFARRATGESDSYVIDLRDIMANSMEKEYAIAMKNKMDAALVANGDAAVVKAGDMPPVLKGEATAKAPFTRLSIKTEDGIINRNTDLYIRKSLYPEYRALHGTDLEASIPGLTKIGERLTRASLVGLSEGTVHVSNLLTGVLTRPGPTANLLANTALKAFGRADVPITIVNVVKNALTASTKQLADLAEIGALKEPYKGSMLAPLISRLDKGVRITLDNVYQGLKDKGLVEDSPAARREFINQVGQYNKRLQGPFIRWLRETQVGPFATAGRAFNVLGARTALLDPGLNATSAAHSAALRMEALSGVIGVAAITAGWNYLRTGQVAPPGVRLGDLYLSTDENGRQKTLALADLMGYGRAMRATGTRGFIESKREGLSTPTAIDQALRDITSAFVAPALGPGVRFGIMATSGKRADQLLDPNAPPEAPRVAPGSQIPQRAANLGYAVTQANPVGGTAFDIYQGKSPAEIAQRQFTRFAPHSAPSPDLIEALPHIVAKQQMEDYIDDVGRRARKLNPAAAEKLFDTAREAVDNMDDPKLRREGREKLKLKQKYQ